jgi:2-(1,2-epoxy-1,2-dihydrophenyl)acetyl-CoA isomerase
MADDELELDLSGAVATVVFNRPHKANAIRPDWPRRILEFLREVECLPRVRCVLFSAKGKHFQAGGELDAQNMTDASNQHERLGWLADSISSWNAMLRVIVRLPKPVVSSIQGLTVGASIGLLGASDLVIAADDAVLWLAQTKHGYTIDGMPSYFLPRQIGQKRAMEWALLGRRINAVEAARLGLINFVVPRENLEAETASLMQELSNGPTMAHALNKVLIRESLEHDFDTQAGLELDTYMQGAMTDDWFEGARAFLGKRAPKFSGR